MLSLIGSNVTVGLQGGIDVTESGKRVSASTSAMSLLYKLCLSGASHIDTSQNNGIEVTRHETRQITEFIISEFILKTKGNIPGSLTTTWTVLKSLINQVLESDGQKFSKLIEEIQMSRLEKTPNLVVKTILDSMFEDGRIHWLRIVAAYAFAIELAKRCDREGNRELGKKVLRAVGDFIINEHIAKWIYDQGGWGNLAVAYRDKSDIEEKLKSAGYLALFVGVGALVTAVTSR